MLCSRSLRSTYKISLRGVKKQKRTQIPPLNPTFTTAFAPVVSPVVVSMRIFVNQAVNCCVLFLMHDWCSYILLPERSQIPKLALFSLNKVHRKIVEEMTFLDFYCSSVNSISSSLLPQTSAVSIKRGLKSSPKTNLNIKLSFLVATSEHFLCFSIKQYLTFQHTSASSNISTQQCYCVHQLIGAHEMFKWSVGHVWKDTLNMCYCDMISDRQRHLAA